MGCTAGLAGLELDGGPAAGGGCEGWLGVAPGSCLTWGVVLGF